MEIGISTACFYPLETELALKRVGETDFSKIEIFFNAAQEIAPDFVKKLRENIPAGARVLSVHPYTSAFEGMLLFSKYERRRREGMEIYEQIFAAAEELGASFVTFHGSRAMAGKQLLDRLEWEEMKRVYGELCARAKAHGVILAQENVAWCRSKDPVFLKALYEDIPELGFTLDIKQAVRAGVAPQAYLEVMGDRLVNLHVSDHTPEDSCVLPGRGTMDFRSFFAKLQQNQYSGHAIIEVYSTDFSQTEDIIKAGAYLKECAPNP